MGNNDSIIDQNAVEHFHSDVIHYLLPNARHKSTFYFGGADVIRASNIKIDLADANAINEGSPYYYNNDYKFIHYTSVSSLINILRNKSLRLYDLSGMDDQLEFEVPLKYLEKKLSEYDIKSIKSKIFSLSMCELGLETKQQSLQAWQKYGNNGSGVGVVLNFNKEHCNEWINFMLSKVFYTEASMKKLRHVEKLYDKFKKDYNLTVNNFEQILFKYYAFHKHKIYSAEREVRLIYNQGFNHYDSPKCFYDINNHFNKTSFIELELEWDSDNKFKDKFLAEGLKVPMIKPFITVENILLGYRLSNKAKYELFEVIADLTKTYKLRPKVEPCKYDDYFKK